MTRPVEKPGKYAGAIALTKQLRRLAAQIDAISGKTGDMISKAEKLAEVVWDRAIGYEEKTADGKLVVHKPEPWAINLLFDRLEGRVPISVDDKTGKTLADKVSELGKAKLNAMLEDSHVDPDSDSGDGAADGPDDPIGETTDVPSASDSESE